MYIIFILLGATIFYLPILLNPEALVARGNDLTEFFWPIIYYIKVNILASHQLPLWNNLFFSGTPLLPDPQNPTFYLPNILFLIFQNIDTGFIILIFLHILASGIAMYTLAAKGFGFDKAISLFCSFIYMFSPKLSGYLEAGHYGLITSWAWLPIIFLLTLLLVDKPSYKKSILLSISLAALYYTHILIFAISTVAVLLLFFYLTLVKKKQIKINIKYLIVSLIACFLLLLIVLLPQIYWQDQTTRNLLLSSPEIYPKWNTRLEFIKATISPLLFGKRFVWELDTEKIIAIGLFSSVFAFLGFLSIKNKSKTLALVVLLGISLLSLNNLSPFYALLAQQNWYILLRVATRFWFLEVFVLIYLSGLGLKLLSSKKKLKILTFLLAGAAVVELLLISWSKINQPIVKNPILASAQVYEFLKKDKDIFRVFCLNRCLSQKTASLYNLELADGYGTLQQKNYYIYSQQLAQAFWRNKYTLSIPPFEIFNYEDLQPYSLALTDYRVKYVISDHILTDNNLALVKKVNNYYIYQNMIFKQPDYLIYSPNFIRVEVINPLQTSLVIPEVYNRDWRAYLNGLEEVEIAQTQQGTRQVLIKKDTKFVDFRYSPFKLLKNI